MECQLKKGLTRPLSKEFAKQLTKYKWIKNPNRPGWLMKVKR